MKSLPLKSKNVNNIRNEPKWDGSYFDEEFYQAEEAWYERKYGLENISALQQKVDDIVSGAGSEKSSIGFIKNIEITSTSEPENGEKSVEEITSEFEEWYNGKLDETIWGVFVKQTEGEEPKVLVLDISDKATKRYFEIGRKRVLKRLRIRLGNTATRGIHLTLTFDPKKIDVKTAWETVWSEFKRFMDALNAARKRKYKTKHRLGYTAVLEEQPGTGYPHLHVWFPQLRFLWNVDKLSDWWAQANNSVNVEYKDKASVVQYVCNYVAKLGKWSMTALAMLWHFGKRLYSISKRYYVRKLEPTGWRLVAVCYTEDDIENALRLLKLCAGYTGASP
jgi:hypothetical protein